MGMSWGGRPSWLMSRPTTERPSPGYHLIEFDSVERSFNEPATRLPLASPIADEV